MTAATDRPTPRVAPPTSADEVARLVALRRYQILDTDPEEVFDVLTRLAARICDTPTALITLIDANRQWFKSAVGFDKRELPLDTGFCPVAAKQKEPLIIADTLVDERFARNPAVTSPPHVRFYAGIPLIAPEGEILGTLCVVDLKPRWMSPEQVQTLQALARETMAQLEIRRSNQGLELTSDQLRLITDAVPSLISYVDSNQRYRYNNKAYEQWLGHSSAQSCGKHLREVLGERAYQAIRQHVEKALSGEPVSYETEMPYQTGGTRWVEASCMPDIADCGTVRGYITLVNDITARKRMEESLRDSEHRLRFVLDSMPQKIFTAKHNGDIDYFNPRWTTFTGLSFEQIRDWGWTQVVHADDVAENVRLWRHAVETGELFQCEHRFRRADGQYRWHISRAQPMRDAQGHIVMWIGSNTDIHNVKRTEETLRESDQRVRLILNSSLDAVVTMNGHGIITGWNAQAETAFGWRREEVMHRDLANLIIPEAHRAAHRSGLEHFLKTGEGPVLNKRLELAALRQDGKCFPIELTIAPLRLDDRVEFSAFIRDITERKRMETALLQANEQLEQRVAVRTAQLTQQAEALQRANEALARSNLELQQFAYVASHDLQSPLRSISGFVQALQAEYKGRLDERADGWIGRTVQATQKMQSLIRHLLAYSRVDSGARPFQRTELSQVLDDVVAMLEVSIRESGAEISRDRLPAVTGDHSQLVQLMQNLISNALKYHGDQALRIHVSAEHDGTEWVVAVRDNGIGIDSRHYGRIFEIFQRLHNSQEYSGIGIGLAVCRRVILRHGGRIWVESEPGQGSVFYFTIPDSTVSVQ